MQIHPGILALLETSYGIGRAEPLQRFETNGQRQAWRLATHKGELVLKVTDPGRPEAVVQSDVGILEYLARYDFPAPRPVYARGGELYLPFEDRYIYLYTCVEGSWPKVTGSLYPRLGAQLARLHQLPFEEYGLGSPYQPPQILAEVKGVLEGVVDEPGEGEMAADLLEKIERFPSFEGLPKGLIHTDPYFVNMLEDSQGRLVLIDWDDAGVSYPLLDAAYIGHLSTFLAHDCVKWNVPQAATVTWRPEWAQAFLDGYQSVRALSSLEKELFGPAVWLNFLAYVWEWGEKRIIPENYQRMKVLEGFRPRF